VLGVERLGVTNASVTSIRRPMLLAAALLALVSLLTATQAVAATSVPGKKAPATKRRADWAPAPAATAAVHPGVQTITPAGNGAQCTANFVFTDGPTAYLGQAAHCAGTGAATETDGCLAASLPLGTPVEILGSDGRSYAGTLVYSSWLTMQAAHETDPGRCASNDFALVQLAAATAATTNPTVPFWGGPTALSPGSAAGEDVYTYGNSSLRGGLTPLSPKYGQVIDVSNGGGTYDLYTVSPGVPGDSGSGFLDASGRALGILSTLSVAPFPASNQVSDLGRALTYLHGQAAFGAVRLVPGTEPFVPLL
jgi:hypothetical protein